MQKAVGMLLSAHTLLPNTHLYISVGLFSKFNLEIKYFGLLGKVSVANTKHVRVFETQEGCEHNVLEVLRPAIISARCRFETAVPGSNHIPVWVSVAEHYMTKLLNFQCIPDISTHLQMQASLNFLSWG